MFCHLLLQIGGANIENPPTLSSLAEERTPPLTPPQHGGARFPDARSRKPRASLAVDLELLEAVPGGLHEFGGGVGD